MATGSGKKRKRSRKGRPDNPAQSKRFIEAAKKLGAGASTEAFYRAMDKLAPKKPKRGSS